MLGSLVPTFYSLFLVVSDMFGKSATSITDYPTSNETFDCVSLLQYSLKKKTAQVLESIEGFSYAEKQKVSIKIV